jgi:hypothetical protein
MRLYLDLKFRARIPSERAHLCANAHFLYLSRIPERIAAPPVLFGSDARADAQRRHRRELRERDERTAAVVRGTHEAHEIDVAKNRSIRAMLTREHHQAKSPGPEKFIDRTERMHASLRADEERSLIPECAGSRAGDVYPSGAITVCDSRSGRRAHDGRRAASRLPDGQPAEREASAGKRAVELHDSGGNRIGRWPRDLDSVWKALFEEGAEGCDLRGHCMEMIPNKHRNNKEEEFPQRRYICLYGVTELADIEAAIFIILPDD